MRAFAPSNYIKKLVRPRRLIYSGSKRTTGLLLVLLVSFFLLHTSVVATTHLFSLPNRVFYGEIWHS